MKKLIISAVLAVAATSAFAQGDALKSILKSKDYAEAEKLLNANLSSLDAQQKAKAYNKLVELAMEKVSKEESTLSTNQLVVQMQQGNPEPYDTLGLYNAAYAAMKNGMECDKYDNMPNAKGKVSPKFHKSNQEKLYRLRTHLINGGQYAAEKGDQTSALNNYALYVESASSPLFADVDKTKEPDLWLGEVAREALGLKVYLMQQGLKTKEDSLKSMKEVEALYATTNKDEQVFNALVTLYGGLGMDQKQLALISERIAVDPNNANIWAMKGQNEMNAEKWDDAIASLKKSIELDDKQAIVFTYLGYSLNSKAGTLATANEQKPLLMESLGYLEKARSLDPNRKDANWSYPLYQCYYSLYGADDSRTKEMEALIK